MSLVREKTYYMGQPKPEKQPTKEWVRPAWFLFTIGWYVALSVTIPTLIGFWLDRPEMFDTRPLFTLIGFGLGTIVAFYGLYRMLRRFQIEQKEQDKKKGTE